MFAKPDIGSYVTVTTDYTDYFKPFALNVKRQRAQSGIVVVSDKLDNPNTFRLATGKTEFPEAVISLSHVISIVDGDGIEADSAAAEPETIETWQVDGSKGNVYTVTRNGEKWSCTCVGFQFRKICKHIKECSE